MPRPDRWATPAPCRAGGGRRHTTSATHGNVLARAPHDGPRDRRVEGDAAPRTNCPGRVRRPRRTVHQSVRSQCPKPGCDVACGPHPRHGRSGGDRNDLSPGTSAPRTMAMSHVTDAEDVSAVQRSSPARAGTGRPHLGRWDPVGADRSGHAGGSGVAGERGAYPARSASIAERLRGPAPGRVGRSRSPGPWGSSVASATRLAPGFPPPRR